MKKFCTLIQLLHLQLQSSKINFICMKKKKALQKHELGFKRKMNEKGFKEKREKDFLLRLEQCFFQRIFLLECFCAFSELKLNLELF